LINFKFKKKNGMKKILILPGTHDIKDFHAFVKDKVRSNQKNKYFFKLHPKNKFSFKPEKNLHIITKLDTIIFNKVIVSSTSTLVYDFNRIKIPIEIFRPDYKLESY